MKKIYYLMAMAMMAFTFTSCEDVPEPFGQPINPNQSEETIDPAGDGTAASPYNVAAAIAKCKEVGEAGSSEKYYIKGIVVEGGEIPAGDTYGNITFKIADTPTSKNMFMAYQVFGSEGVHLPNGYKVEVGAEIVLYGPIVNYKNNTPETQGKGAAHIVTINGKPTGGEEPTPSGEAKAVSVADFLKAAVNTTDFYQLTGTVKNLKDGDQYGNFDLEDATGSVYVYGLLSEKGGEKKKFQELVAAKGIANGKKITIIGNRGEYNNNPQVTNAYFVKIEDGGTPAPSGDVKTVTIADFNAAAESKDVWYQLTGTIKNLKDGDIYGNFDLEDATGSVYVYGLLSEKGGEKKKFQELVAAKGIANGKKITIIGNRGSYGDKIEVLNAYFVSIEGGEGGGNTGGNGGEAVTSLTNGDFETWAGGLPTGWKSASTASSATLEQSTDAHGGSYACIVKGDEGSNKRLGSQEITLAAGTYTFSFWVKATTSDVAQVRPGYVPVDDSNKAGNYAYGDYANITTTWQQVSHEFTLDAETKVCLVVMNPKKSKYSSGKDVLIDDATLTKK